MATGIPKEIWIKVVVLTADSLKSEWGFIYDDGSVVTSDSKIIQFDIPYGLQRGTETIQKIAQEQYDMMQRSIINELGRYGVGTGDE